MDKNFKSSEITKNLNEVKFEDINGLQGNSLEPTERNNLESYKVKY